MSMPAAHDPATPIQETAPHGTVLAVGAYTSSGRGRGSGVQLLNLQESADAAPVARHLATVDLEDSSFLLWSPDGTLLYAVQETSPSRLAAIRVRGDGSSARLLDELELRGAGACHLALGTTPGTLLVTHYGSGTVETVMLDEHGVPAEVIDVHDHHDHADGADPHPHQVSRLPGTDLFAVPDLGLDRVLLYRQDVHGQADLAGEIPLSRGMGPRHLAADHESGQLFIACELSGQVAVAARRQDAGSLRQAPVTGDTELSWSFRGAVSASRQPGHNDVSHIELTADEGALLVANRGPDSLSLLSLVGMRPEVVAEVEVGEHPRHFTQLGDLVLVAAQESDRIDVLRRHGEELVVAGDPIPAPSATCLAARP